MSEEGKEPNHNWAVRVKDRSKEIAVALGAITILVPTVGALYGEVKEQLCLHVVECTPDEPLVNTKPEQQQPVSPTSNAGTAGGSEIESPQQKLQYYTSDVLRISFAFPEAILTLHNVDRFEGVISLLDSSANTRVVFRRKAAESLDDMAVQQDREAEALAQSGHVITYKAPEKAKNRSNWYVLSGLKDGNGFYYRRTLVGKEMVSYEVRYPKSQQPTYTHVINTLHDTFQYN
ncbi:MAG: hypothetical protein OXR62_11200 [Ahrensia sp.]|nr:hypothetical protein [Ahrensia sp.]